MSVFGCCKTEGLCLIHNSWFIDVFIFFCELARIPFCAACFFQERMQHFSLILSQAECSYLYNSKAELYSNSENIKTIHKAQPQQVTRVYEIRILKKKIESETSLNL